MLEIKQVTLAYGKAAPAVRELSLTAAPGITAILGQNGAGKSTLLHAVAGLLPHTGEIALNGTPLSSLPPRVRARLVSLLPQRLPAPALCVREVIALGFSPHITRLSQKEWQTVEEIEQKLALTALSKRALHTLSGGERQRVFWGMLLAQDTPVWLLDEPTTYADAETCTQFYRLLREQRERGKIILLVAHDLTAALELADHVIVLSNGACVFCGTPAECMAAQIPEQYFAQIRYTATDGEGNTRFFYRAKA